MPGVREQIPSPRWRVHVVLIVRLVGLPQQLRGQIMCKGVLTLIIGVYCFILGRLYGYYADWYKGFQDACKLMGKIFDEVNHDDAD